VDYAHPAGAPNYDEFRIWLFYFIHALERKGKCG
jgi:hypothetical protein